jgi:hypothetical protein
MLLVRGGQDRMVVSEEDFRTGLIVVMIPGPIQASYAKLHTVSFL